MKTEIDRQLDRERHEQDREGRMAEAIAVAAALNPCPTCGEDVTPEEIEHCSECGRVGCPHCFSLKYAGEIDGPFCDEDCRYHYYWGFARKELNAAILSLNMPFGYWPSENAHGVVTHDGLRAVQVDFIHTDGPILRVQILERKAG